MNSKGKSSTISEARGASKAQSQTNRSQLTSPQLRCPDMPKGGVSMPKGGVVRPEGGAEEWKALFMEEPLKSVPLDDLRKNHSKEVVEKVRMRNRRRMMCGVM